MYEAFFAPDDYYYCSHPIKLTIYIYIPGMRYFDISAPQIARQPDRSKQTCMNQLRCLSGFPAALCNPSLSTMKLGLTASGKSCYTGIVDVRYRNGRQNKRLQSVRSGSSTVPVESHGAGCPLYIVPARSLGTDGIINQCGTRCAE